MKKCKEIHNEILSHPSLNASHEEIRKINKINVNENVERSCPITLLEEMSTSQSLQKMGWSSLRNLKLDMSHESANLSLGIYMSEISI